MYVDSTLLIDWNRGVSTPSKYLQRPSLAVPVEDSRANLKKEMWVRLIIKQQKVSESCQKGCPKVATIYLQWNPNTRKPGGGGSDEGARRIF